MTVHALNLEYWNKPEILIGFVLPLFQGLAHATEPRPLESVKLYRILCDAMEQLSQLIISEDNAFHQPPYRREAPLGDTPLYKKQLGVLLHIFNIL
jgi:hypothetical protein